jgi:hypothetical protein
LRDALIGKQYSNDPKTQGMLVEHLLLLSDPSLTLDGIGPRELARAVYQRSDQPSTTPITMKAMKEALDHPATYQDTMLGRARRLFDKICPILPAMQEEDITQEVDHQNRDRPCAQSHCFPIQP